MTATGREPSPDPLRRYYVDMEIDGLDIPVVTADSLASFAIAMDHYAHKRGRAAVAAARTWDAIQLVVRRSERLYERAEIAHEHRLGALAVIGGDYRMTYIPTATFPELAGNIEYKLKPYQALILMRLSEHLVDSGVVLDAHILPARSVGNRPAVRAYRHAQALEQQPEHVLPIDLDALDVRDDVAQDIVS